MATNFSEALEAELIPPYSVSYLAQLLHRSPSTFTRLITAERSPSPDLLIEIALALSACPERLKSEPHRTFIRTWLKLANADRLDRQEKRNRRLKGQFIKPLS